MCQKIGLRTDLEPIQEQPERSAGHDGGARYQYDAVIVTSPSTLARQAKRSSRPSPSRAASASSTAPIPARCSAPATTRTRQAAHTPVPRHDRPMGSRARTTARKSEAPVTTSKRLPDGTNLTTGTNRR